MWTRKQVKEKGKVSFRKNYWKAIVVALILTVIVGGASGNFSGTGSGLGNAFNNAHEDSLLDGGHLVMDADKDADGNYNITVDTNDESDDIVEKDTKKSETKNSDTKKDEIEVSKDIDKNGEVDGKGAIAAVAIIVISVMTLTVIVFAITLAIDALLINPVEMGCNRFFLKNLDEEADLSNVTFAFDHNYKNVVEVMIRRDIAIVLWSMLFVVPGIIKSYEYRMIPYLLADNPNMSYKEAFAMSKEMMDGNKWKAFVLDLSFIGWQLLSVLTLGLLSIFYVNPYKFATNAALYEALKSGRSNDMDNVEMVQA